MVSPMLMEVPPSCEWDQVREAASVSIKCHSAPSDFSLSQGNAMNSETSKGNKQVIFPGRLGASGHTQWQLPKGREERGLETSNGLFSQVLKEGWNRDKLFPSSTF